MPLSAANSLIPYDYNVTGFRKRPFTTITGTPSRHFGRLAIRDSRNWTRSIGRQCRSQPPLIARPIC
jgi:hypothetical protein